MAKALTPITVANLKPRAKRFEISDPGCAGCASSCSRRQEKVYILRYRFRGLQRKLTWGRA